MSEGEDEDSGPPRSDVSCSERLVVDSHFLNFLQMVIAAEMAATHIWHNGESCGFRVLLYIYNHMLTVLFKYTILGC